MGDVELPTLPNESKRVLPQPILIVAGAFDPRFEEAVSYDKELRCLASQRGHGSRPRGKKSSALDAAHLEKEAYTSFTTLRKRIWRR